MAQLSILKGIQDLTGALTNLIWLALIWVGTWMTSKGLSSLQYSESNVWDQLSVGIKHLRLRCYFLNLSGGLSLSQKKTNQRRKLLAWPSKPIHISRPLTFKPGSPRGRHLMSGKRGKGKPVKVQVCASEQLYYIGMTQVLSSRGVMTLVGLQQKESN